MLKRTHKVKINRVESENVEVRSGVPQGSVLGPLLFLIYIDDLPCKITSCQIFADDTKIYGPVSTATQHQSMQDINHMTEWSETWLLRFNTTKCKVMHVETNNQRRQYSMNEKQLTVVEKRERSWDTAKQ